MAGVAVAGPAPLLRRAGTALAGAGSLLAVLLAWWAAAHLHVVSDFLLPGPDTVFGRLAADLASGDLEASLLLTLRNALCGFVLAGVLGTLLGVGAARLRLVRWAFDPLLSLGYPMPKIAFLPVFMLWFGPAAACQILIVGFSCLFPVAVAAMAGAEGVDKTLIWSARSLGTGERQSLWRVVLPAAVPQIFTGLQIALPISLITAIVAEMLTGSDGLGGAMLQSMRFADSPGVFSGIIAIGAVGFVLVRGMEMLRARLLRWHAEAEH